MQKSVYLIDTLDIIYCRTCQYYNNTCYEGPVNYSFKTEQNQRMLIN